MDQPYIHQARIRQIFFIVCVVLLGALLAKEFSVFLSAFLGALTLYIVMRKPMMYLVYTKKWSKGLTATLLMIASFLVIMIPIGGLVGMMSSKVSYAIGHSNELIEALQTVLSRLEKQLGFEIISPENISKVGKNLYTL